MTTKEAIAHTMFDDIRHYFAGNLDVKGDPISMNLEGLELEDIRLMVIEEFKYYQSLGK